MSTLRFLSNHTNIQTNLYTELSLKCKTVLRKEIFYTIHLSLNKLKSLPLSQVIDSIGYPATGHFIFKSLPATAVTLGISRIYGRPYTLTLAAWIALPPVLEATQAYSPPSCSVTLLMLRWLTTSSWSVTRWPTANLYKNN